MCVLHQDDLEVVKELLAIEVHNAKSEEDFEVHHVKSSLITLDEETTGISHLLEYHPMVNARAHIIGKDGAHKILNRQFRETYDKFLDQILHKKIVNEKMTSSDLMTQVYYLQL